MRGGPGRVGPDAGDRGGGDALPAATEGHGEVAEAAAITVLGDLTASRGGVELDLGGRRQRAVLGLLVVARGDAIAADRLIHLLWADHPPSGPSGALQSYVSHLRRALEPERTARSRASIIIRSGSGYALRVAPDAVDAWRFEELVRRAAAEVDPDARVAVLTAALGLWRGPAFGEYQDEPWAQPEAARLAELREVAREQLIEARLGRGETAVVVPEIEALVAEQPLREERWRLFVLALYRSRRQGDALSALRRAREVLAAELGIDPGPALRALEAEVLRQSPALEAPAPAPSSPVPPPSTPAPAPSTAPTLIPSPAIATVPAIATAPGPSTAAGPGLATGPAPGPGWAPLPARPGGWSAPVPAGDDLVDRDREVAELAACVADAAEAQARLVVIEGPAGIGKSRLLVEARRPAVAGGFRVLTARGSQLEREFAFGAVRQLFEAEVAAATPDHELLTGPAAQAATVFDLGQTGDMPNLWGGRVGPDPRDGRDGGRPGDAPAVPRGDGSLAVLHGLYWLTMRLAAQAPIMLAVDDLQWCDSASLRFLAYLVRRTEGMPVLIVATVRTGERGEDEALLAEVTHDPATVWIRPAPLGRHAVADLVRARLGTDAQDGFVAACHDATAGNPLYLRQLLRALLVEGVRPDSAHAGTVTTIGSRAVSSLVLMRLARMPRESITVARWIAVLGGGAVLPTVAALAGLSDAATAAAVGALARAEVLRDDYPLGFVHPLVADAVYRDLPPGERQLHHDSAARVLYQSGAAPEQIAAHLLQVPHRGDPWVVDVLRRAAARASERGAPDAAASYLARALREQPEPRLRAQVLPELAHAAVLGDGVAAVTHLAQAYAELEAGPLRAEMAQMLTRALTFAGTPGEATRFGYEVADELPAELDDERQGLLGLARIGGYMHDVEAAVWRRQPEPAVSGGGPGARMLASALSWELAIDGTDRARAIELARFAVDGGVLTRADVGLLCVVAGVTLHLADEDTDAVWAESLAYAHQHGSVFGALGANLWRAYCTWGLGDLREAYQLFRIASDQSASWGLAFGAGYANGYAVGVLIDMGDLAGARSLADQVRDTPRPADADRVFAEMHAGLHIAHGRFEEALIALDDSRALMVSARNPGWRPWRSLRARALSGLGRHAAAVELLGEELAAARAWGAPSAVGRTLRLLGELRFVAGDVDGGVDDLREAAALLAPTRSRLEYARALYALAGVSKAAETTVLLGQAADLAWRCGATGMYERIRDRLAVAGAPLARRPAVELTRTERDIVTRQAAGADEREIAEALFVTPQTIHRILASARERRAAHIGG
ncbi:BTAD domain-containing putative transcriptional regulator [Frankia sp. R43]|uniref:BTAD domain-containing putative transcriptional regulator n=1 Tax=Frankia sp. R43 TaxID=269536 RepID=UPI0006CA2093|nr:BTAD domain-containing putative transcriptional regulator [Frankia sp. R43]